MNTLYGKFTDEFAVDYLESLTNRIFKILPMYEEECETLNEYVSSINREIFGNSKIFFCGGLLVVTGTLEGLNYDSHKDIKSDVFKMCDLIKKIQMSVI